MSLDLFQIVKQMPKMVKAKQPSIAIITAHYCEKLAVDSMIENQETFVRYTTVGKWLRMEMDFYRKVVFGLRIASDV